MCVWMKKQAGRYLGEKGEAKSYRFFFVFCFSFPFLSFPFLFFSILFLVLYLRHMEISNGLNQSYSNARSELHLQPTPKFVATRILNPLSEARDRTSILMDTNPILNMLSHNRNSQVPQVFERQGRV